MPRPVQWPAACRQAGGRSATAWAFCSVGMKSEVEAGAFDKLLLLLTASGRRPNPNLPCGHRTQVAARQGRHMPDCFAGDEQRLAARGKYPNVGALL